jgi:hypothetical protein
MIRTKGLKKAAALKGQPPDHFTTFAPLAEPLGTFSQAFGWTFGRAF